MDNPKENTNILSKLKTPSVFYPLVAMIIFLIIMMCLIFFKVPINFSSTPKVNSQNEVVSDIFIILFFSLIVFLLCFILLPNFKEFKALFQQISSVTYVILYTIFLILFLTLMPRETLNSYATYITPITIVLGLFSFYKAAKTDYVEKFNINYERIKTIIMIFCLITCYILYYNIDPGGFISNSFGYSLLLTIIISVFALLYLIILLTLNDNKQPDANANPKPSSLFENFSNFSVYGTISFIIFLIIVTILISTYPGGFFSNPALAGSTLIILLLICGIWSTLIASNLFPEFTNKKMDVDYVNFFKRALLMLFGTIISGLIIFWIVYNIQNLSSSSSIASFILNLFLVIIILGLIYKTINVNLPVGNSKKNGFFNIIINLIFYIPCVFSEMFDIIGKFATGGISADTAGSLIMLAVAILLIIAYFGLPMLFNKLNLQGGKQLVNKPVYTNSQYSLATYEELNGDSKDPSGNYLPTYQYAISFWVFIDAVGPNTNGSYDKYTSLLNFGEKPNVLYNGKINTLMVTMRQKDIEKNTTNKFIELDDNGNRIIYKSKDILLQKWNNIIINYNGGVLDVFINGELVKSDIGVVPYYTIDSLTIGENNGLKGGICNVIYFNKPLTGSKIHNLYNSVKLKTPPTTNESNTTILTYKI
jgi:hypothetical protein